MLKSLKRIALQACIIFTLAMLFCGASGLVFVGPEKGILMTFGLLALALIFALLQALWFTDGIVKKMSYATRTICFGVCAFVPLSICGLIFDWLPIDNLLAWVGFTITYLVILIVIAICYSIYYKRTLGSYEEALKRYHENHRQKEH